MAQWDLKPEHKGTTNRTTMGPTTDGQAPNFCNIVRAGSHH